MSDEFVNTYLDDKYFYGKDKNEDLIKQMELAYLYHKDKEKKEKSEYLEIASLYDEFVSKTAALLKLLNKDENLFLYPLILTNLIELGITGEYMEEFNVLNAFDLHDYFGINVAMGHGVCRNVNSFANDVFKKLGLKSETVLISLNSDSIKPNHLITLIEYNGMYFGMDVYNNMIFTFSNYNHLECVYNLEMRESRVPIFQYYAYMGLKEKQVDKLLNKLSTPTPIDFDYIYALQKEANDIVDFHNSETYDYYQDTKELKNKIKNVFKEIEKKKR